jgi:hypothetical protein
MAKPSLFPSILPDADFVDDTYSEDELNRKDYDELRQIAADHESESVHGRMGKDELVEALEGLQRV